MGKGKTGFILGLFFILLLQGMSACYTPAVSPVSVEKPLEKLDHDFSLLHKMQGRWIDQKNDEAILEISGVNLISEFQGEVMNQQEIIIVKDFPESCKGTPSKDGIGFFITSTDHGPFCYQVIELNENGIRYEAVGLID